MKMISYKHYLLFGLWIDEIQIQPHFHFCDSVLKLPVLVFEALSKRSPFLPSFVLLMLQGPLLDYFNASNLCFCSSDDWLVSDYLYYFCSTKYFVLGSCAWFMRFTDHNSIYVRRYERFAKGLISQAVTDQIPDLFEMPWSPPSRSCCCVIAHTMCKTWTLLLFSEQGLPLRRSVLYTSRDLFTSLAVCCFWNMEAKGTMSHTSDMTFRFDFPPPFITKGGLCPLTYPGDNHANLSLLLANLSWLIRKSGGDCPDEWAKIRGLTVGWNTNCTGPPWVTFAWSRQKLGSGCKCVWSQARPR